MLCASHAVRQARDGLVLARAVCTHKGKISDQDDMSDTPRFFDEMQQPGGDPRAPYGGYSAWFHGEDLRDLRKKSADAERFFRRTGITFNVYGQAEAD